MRLWSLHPKYLDSKGLVALWREALLGKNVLEGKTKGYKNHPQLNRFKNTKYPVDSINQYLSEVYNEASNRNYKFDKQKINWGYKKNKVTVTFGQLNFEVKHLLSKLKTRDSNKHKELINLQTIDIHPLFEIIDGEIEDWEILKSNKK